MAELDLNPREAYGQLYFLDNTIESLTGDIDIEIGVTGSTADLKFNRNTVLAPGKTFGLVDSVTDEIVRMSVSGGILDIDGANQLQVGQLKFVDNTIESSTGDIDIQIGLTGSAADLKLNRNVVLAKGKSLSLVDHYLDETTTLFVASGSLIISGARQLQVGDIQIYNDTIESLNPNIDIQLGATSATADLVINRNTKLYPGKTLTVSGSVNVSGSLNVNGQPVVLGPQGWARYDDTQYTTSSVFSLTTELGEQTLPNNSGNKIETHLHSTLSFYDSGSQKIQVENDGDVYMCTVTFKAKTGNAQNAYFRLELTNTVGTPYNRVGKDLFFPKGNNVWHDYHEVFQYYADTDFVTNGNEWSVQSFGETIDISNVIYFIQRTQNHLI